MGIKSKWVDIKNNFNYFYGEKVNVFVVFELILF